MRFQGSRTILFCSMLSPSALQVPSSKLIEAGVPPVLGSPVPVDLPGRDWIPKILGGPTPTVLGRGYLSC